MIFELGHESDLNYLKINHLLLIFFCERYLIKDNVSKTGSNISLIKITLKILLRIYGTFNKKKKKIKLRKFFS